MKYKAVMQGVPDGKQGHSVFFGATLQGISDDLDNRLQTYPGSTGEIFELEWHLVKTVEAKA